MRVAQRPTESDIHRTVTDEGRAVITAAGGAELHGNFGGMGQLDNLVHKIGADTIGIVHGADYEAFADGCVSEPFIFEWRIGTHERINREDVVWRMASGGEALRGSSSAVKAELFANGKNEGDVAILERAAEGPSGGDEGGVADAIIETACIGARAEQR